MKTITDNVLGLALFVVSGYATQLKYNEENPDQAKTFESLQDLITSNTPLGVFEEIEEHTDPVVLGLIAHYADPDWEDEEGQTSLSLLPIHEFEERVKLLKEMVDRGELAPLVDAQADMWGQRDDSDYDPGVLVDEKFLVTLIERAMKATNCVKWDNGPFLVVVSSDRLWLALG